MIRAWRIVHPRREPVAFSGDGSRQTGGRWNSKGVKAVYLAESLALATLEVLVHGLPYVALQDYLCIPVDIPPMMITTLDLSKLPENWRDDPPPGVLQKMGDDWLRGRNSAVLRIPSAVIPVENNYLLNPDQKDFIKLKFGAAMSFRFDSRLTRLSKDRK